MAMAMNLNHQLELNIFQYSIAGILTLPNNVSEDY